MVSELDEEALITAARKASRFHIKVTGIYAHEMGAEATDKSFRFHAYKTLEIMSNLAIKFKNAGIELNDVSVGASLNIAIHANI